MTTTTTISDLPLLHVCEQAWGDARARTAAVHVTLTASKLFSGRAALTKSEELRRLVGALREHGIPEDAISLEGASLDVSTGLFSRSSSVTYRVRIQVANLDLIAAVLETIADAKQATLTHITRDHSGNTTESLLAECAARAADKAKRLAASLGVTLGAAHEVREEEHGTHPPPQQQYPQQVFAMAGMVMRKRSATSTMTEELGGLDLAPTQRVGVTVRIAYRVAP